ncbi:hypothetical protein [Leptospira saintgironsiae]|nr:hypothetical protein [Leptospira saintgironsiae]
MISKLLNRFSLTVLRQKIQCIVLSVLEKRNKTVTVFLFKNRE